MSSNKVPTQYGCIFRAMKQADERYRIRTGTGRGSSEESFRILRALDLQQNKPSITLFLFQYLITAKGAAISILA
jgi:hypothetical protein